MTETRTIRRAYPRAITLDTGTTIALRLMTAADAPLIVAFARSLPPDDLLFLRTDITDPRVVAQWVRNLEAGRSVTGIAENAGEVAGYASLHYNEIAWQRHLGEIPIQAGGGSPPPGPGRGAPGGKVPP